MLILLLLVVVPLFNAITSNIDTTSVTAITTMPKGMKVKISRNFEGGRLTESQHPVFMQVVKKAQQQYLKSSLLCKVETNRSYCEVC